MRVPSSPSLRRILPLAIVLLTLLTFAPAFRADFLNWDDQRNFKFNPNYRGLSWNHLQWMWTTFHMGHYQPLSWMTLGADYLVWGMNPAGYHLTSILIHAAGSVALFFVAGGLLRSAFGSEQPTEWGAFLVALVFALHPLRVESVVWITERRDVLSGLFFLLSLLAYLRMSQEQEAGGRWKRWLALSLTAFAASLLSKALGIALPAVLLALDVYPLKRFSPGRRRAVLLEKGGFFAIAALDGLAMLQAMNSIQAVRPLSGYDLPARMMQASYGLTFYLWKTLVPLGLSPVYPLEPRMNPWEGRYLLCFAVVVSLATAAWSLRARLPAFGIALFSYSILALPVLGIVVTGYQIAADRYSYLSCMPWAVVAGALVLRYRLLVSRTGRAALAGFLLLLGGLTFRQSGIWKDSGTLWHYVLERDPSVAFAWSNLGGLKAATGDPEGALADFNKALQLDPTFANAYSNRGNVRLSRGDLAGAFADFDEAIRLKPGLADALSMRSAAWIAKGDLDRAVADATEALSRDPLTATAWTNRGLARMQKKDLDGAIVDLTRALEIDPQTPGAYNNRGLARMDRGDASGAVDDYSQALRINPSNLNALFNRGVARRRIGDLRGAAADLDAVLARAPSGWSPRKQVAQILEQIKKELAGSP
jgi:tetratricopeptide (TPR) repeat protein